MAKKNCILELQSAFPDVYKYLEAEVGDYSDDTKQAWGRAARKLQNETLNNLQNIYSDLGVTNSETGNPYERIIPQSPSSSNTPKEEVPVGDGESDVDIEKRMLEIQDSNPSFDSKEQSEFNALEKEMEKRERATVFNVPLEEINSSVDALMQKEKEMPNGFGSFIEKRDARETKEVADRYLNAKELTDAELKKDFKDAVMGNPDTWYADGLRLRESMKEAANRGIDIEVLLKEVEKQFTKDGFDIETARRTIAGMLKPVFEGSQKVNEKQLPVVKEGVNTKEQVGSGGQGELVKTKEASNEEPPLPEGETIVTLSGMTESERQNKISERQGKSGLNEAEKSENKLAELSYKANNLRAGSEKTNSQSNIRQEVRKLNAEIGFEKYKYNGVNVFKKTTLRKGGNKGKDVWRKVSAINKDVGNQSIKEGGRTIRDRSVELQNNFDNLVDVAEHLEVMDANGRQMSKDMIDAAIQDIYDGIPSVQAENLLEVLEEAIEKDAFPVRDNFTNQQVRLNDLLGVKSKIISEPLTEEAIKKWLNDESKLTPEQEDILNKEFENILYEYPEIEIEVPISATQSRTEKTTTPKVESKTTAQQTSKEVDETIQADTKGTQPVISKEAQQPKKLATEDGKAAEEKSIKQKGKELADRIRQLKSKKDILQTNIFGIPIAIYDGLIETVATAVEAGTSLAEAIQNAINSISDKNFDKEGFKKSIEDFSAGEKPRIKVSVGEETKITKEKIEQDDKSILARMVKSEKVSDDVKDILKESGLKYKTKKQKEARQVANSIIDEFGIDEAVNMAEGGRFHGDVNSMIFAVSLDKVFAEEQSGQNPEEKQVAAERWANTAIRYQDAAESGGRFISAIYDFYKKSPAGLVIKIEKEFQRRQNEYFEGREKPTKEAWEEFINTVEGKELLEEEIAKRKKEGSKIFSPESEKKIKSFFAKLRIDTKGQAGSYLLPPQIFNAAIDIIEQTVLTGVTIGKAIEKAVDYINENFKETWQIKEFKKEIRDGFKNQNVKRTLSESDKEKILKKWQRKLGGLNADQRNNLLNKAFLELVDNGALEYEDFKKMYADAVGLPQMTDELKTKLVDLANKINEPDKIKEKILNTKDTKLISQYQQSVTDAERASTTLNELIGKQKWWVNTFLTVMRLNTLGFVSLLGNIAYNVAALPVRFATNLTATGLDYLLARVQLTSDKVFGTDLYKHPPIHNVFKVQGGFARGIKLGTTTAVKQFFTGLTNRDYFQREIRQNIKPLTSAKRLIRSMTGKEKLTLNEKLNAFIEAFPTMGVSAEVIARALNVGDKPFRYAAEYAAAEILAQQKGLTGIDKEIFVLFPDEDSEKKIKEQGEKIVFQQKNVVTKMFDSAGNAVSNYVNELGWEAKTLHGIGKTLGYATQPFLNTPLNVFNEFIHYAFPPLPLYKAGRAMVKGDTEQSTYHLAQAVTGMSIAYAAGILAANGLIVPAGGDDDEAKERLGIQAYQRRGQLNVSGLKKWLAGDPPENEDGDVWIDLKYYGFIGMLMLTKAKQYKGKTKQEIEQDTYVQDMVGQFVPAVKIGLTEGVFSGTSSLLNSMSMGGGYVDNYLLGMGNVVVNAFEPQWLRQISLASNDYYRDPKGMALPETAKNQLKQRFFMGGQLPAKVNIWGDKVESVPNNTNPYLYNVFGLNKAAVFDNDRFGFVLYDYYNKTKDYNIFPPALKREVNDNPLTPEQYEEFSILVGSHRKQLISPLIESGSFESMKAAGHETVIKELSKLYEDGRDIAIKEFVGIHPEFQKAKKK